MTSAELRRLRRRYQYYGTERYHPVYVPIEDVDVTAVRTFIDFLVKKNLAHELLVIPRLKAQFDVTYDDAKQLWDSYTETVGQRQIGG